VIVLHQRTVIQTHHPEDGDRYIPVVVIEGISLPIDPVLPVVIDGVRWIPAGARSVTIDTRGRAITTTITVVEDY
jgi:hypothetical protein